MATIYSEIMENFSPGYGIRQASAHAVLEMCVTMDSKKLLTRHCIALCKAPTSFPPPSSNTAPQWLLRSVLPRFRGLGKGIS